VTNAWSLASVSAGTVWAVENADPVQLSPDELAALRSAGTWYANYHAREIAAEAGETAAYALEDRRRFLELVSALRKLGVRFPLPDALQDAERRAA